MPKKFPWLWVLGAAGVATLFAIFKQRAVEVISSAFRDPLDILNAVDTINPEQNPDLQPTGGLTHCNLFAHMVAVVLGVPLIWEDYGTLANDIITWLDAGNEGWYQLGSAAAAQEAALKGNVVFATLYNFSGHGHIALVLPVAGNVQIAQAGTRNFNAGSLSKGFGFKQPSFYAHE